MPLQWLYNIRDDDDTFLGLISVAARVSRQYSDSQLKTLNDYMQGSTNKIPTPSEGSYQQIFPSIILSSTRKIMHHNVLRGFLLCLSRNTNRFLYHALTNQHHTSWIQENTCPYKGEVLLAKTNQGGPPVCRYLPQVPTTKNAATMTIRVPQPIAPPSPLFEQIGTNLIRPLPQ